MNSVPKINRWQAGRVDLTKEHFELRYGSANSPAARAVEKSSTMSPTLTVEELEARLRGEVVEVVDPGRDWISVALVGRPIAGIVNVQFLVNPGDPKNTEAVSDVKKEIQYYLFELRGPDPWAYAKYHCGTASNVYGNVHWFFEAGKRAELGSS